MDYLFNVFLWNIPGGTAVFKLSTIPSVISTVILSPFAYLLVKLIYNKFDNYNKLAYYSPDNSIDDNEQKIKNNYMKG